MSPRLRPKSRRCCAWCKATLGLRSRLRAPFCGFCTACHRLACCEAGIYLQNGGPPFPGGSRAGVQE